MKKEYCLTLGFKILIVQFILNFTGLILGYSWQLCAENKKWNNLIYNDIKIAGINLGGKTKQQAKQIIQSEYIEQLLKKKLYVTMNDKVYSIDNANLIKDYKINYAVENAFKIGKDLSIIKKHELINYGCDVNLNLNFLVNNNSVNDFTKNIEKQVNRDPVNADINVTSDGTLNLYSETNGYKLQTGQLDNDIQNSIKAGINKNVYIKAPVQKKQASLTKVKLSLINASVSNFQTSFQSSSYNRSNNIDVCVKALDGAIIMPGEVFSFNQRVGERTKQRGYMEAPLIIGDKVESGLGGGICQVSSTLYNAILHMGIQPIERFHHSMPSSYVGIGLDATVDWGNIDLKFKNTLGYPIYIQGYTKNKNLYINIFSNSELNKRKYVIENSIYEVVDTATQTIYTPDKDKDKFNFNLFDGHYGYKVRVLRKTYNNNVLVNYEIVSDDYYPPCYPPLIKSSR